MPLHARLLCVPPSLPSPGAQAGGPTDLALRKLEHLHGLLHQAFLVALPQQTVTGAKVAEKLGRKELKREGGVRGVAGGADGVE